jgi:hypothetical protein
VLSCFGGAGPQHCCAIAKSLGMSKIVVHQYSGEAIFVVVVIVVVIVRDEILYVYDVK